MIKRYVFFLILLGSFVTPDAWCQKDDILTRLIDSLEQTSNRERMIELNLKIAREYWKSNFEKSLEYAEHAEALSLEINNQGLYYTTLYVKAQSFVYLDLPDSCFICLDKIIKNLESIDDRELLGNVYSLYGSVLEDIRDLEKARTMLNRALTYHAADSNSIGMATVYNRIAIILRSESQYDSAAYFSIQSLILYEFAGDSIGMVKSLGSLGKMFIYMEDFGKARNYLLKGYRILQRIDHKRFEALILQNLGIVHFKEEHYDSATYYYNLSLEIYQEINSRISIAYLYGNLGAVYDDMKNYDKALEYFQKALHMHEEINNPAGIVGGKNNIAIIYERKGLYNQALLIYDTVLQLAIEYNLTRDIVNTYNNIYKTYALAGNYEKAYEFKTIYHQIQDSLMNLEKESAIADLELKYGKEKDQAEILFLNNTNLEQELKIKQRTNQRNLYTSLGFIAVISVLMIYFVSRQRMIKDRIIRMKEIARLNEERKALSARSLVEGQEEERKRVARELHDGIGVLLSSAKLQFTNIGEKVPEKKELFERATGLLEKAAGDVRQISHNLMPGNLVRFGLFDALEDLLDSIDESDSMSAKFQLEGSTDRLPEKLENMIYRIVQELINNTIKHANASLITLSVRNTEEAVTMLYSDNGKGFIVEKLTDTGSLGLKSIQSRVDFLEGNMEIDSAMGKGARFSIIIPLKVPAN